MKLRFLATATVGASLLFAACGSDDDASTADTARVSATSAPATSAGGAASTTIGAGAGGSATTGAASATFNDADVTFAQGMIPHHEQAIEMADIALDPAVGASAEVKELATRIKAGQDPEIEMMSSWLTAWGHPMTMDTSMGHDMSSMEGMMSAEEMDALSAMTGAEFDSAFMEMMIRHHEGAIAMAETEKASGSNPEAVALADQIMSAQRAEIAEMQALLGG